MKVRDVMQRQTTTVAADDTLALALQLMLWGDIRHLPVLEGDKVVGVLSRRDIQRARAEFPQLGIGVKDAMSAPAAYIHPDAELADAAADMSTRAIGCLPVIDAGVLVGILSSRDLLGDIAQYPIAETGHPSLSAGDLMTRDPIAVSATDRLLAAATTMSDRAVRHLPVVDVERRVLGMLSERDVRTQIGNPLSAAEAGDPSRRLAALRVADAMTEGARVAVTTTPLADLVNIFLVEHVGAVSVVDAEDRLAGVVSYIDVLRAVAAGVAS